MSDQPIRLLLAALPKRLAACETLDREFTQQLGPMTRLHPANIGARSEGRARRSEGMALSSVNSKSSCEDWWHRLIEIARPAPEQWRIAPAAWRNRITVQFSKRATLRRDERELM